MDIVVKYIFIERKYDNFVFNFVRFLCNLKTMILKVN